MLRRLRGKAGGGGAPASFLLLRWRRSSGRQPASRWNSACTASFPLRTLDAAAPSTSGGYAIPARLLSDTVFKRSLSVAASLSPHPAAVSAAQASQRCFTTTAHLCAPPLSSSSPSPSVSSRKSRPPRSPDSGARHRSKSGRSSAGGKSSGKRSSSSRPRRHQHKKSARTASENAERNTLPEVGEEDGEGRTNGLGQEKTSRDDQRGESADFTEVLHDSEGLPFAPDRRHARHNASAADASHVADQATHEPGWGLESVNATTGKTALEELYDRNLSRIHRILEQPLPPMPQDGSVDPDFFVGFASYSYQLRDQYRAVIARELQVPVKAVRLSVAWSGRFNVKRFNRVQKVCGVCLDREIVSHTHEGNTTTTDQMDQARSSPQAASDTLSDALQQRISAFVAAINTQKREDLLQVQLFQASPPLPEVEFALTRQEHRLVYHLHEWIRRKVLQRAVAVIVYGLPPPPSSPPPHTAAEERAAVQRRFELWQRKAVEETATQHSEVQSRWQRLFHRRKVVPAVVSLTELATSVAVAVVRGRVAGVKCAEESQSDTKNMEVAVELSGPLRELVQRIANDAATVSSESCDGSDGASSQEMLTDATALAQHTRPAHHDALLPTRQGVSQDVGVGGVAAAASVDAMTPAQQEAALLWVRLVFQALLLRETHSAGATLSASVSGASLEVSLPALFAQGVYAGGRREVAYLQHNRTAMDALLLHPHEISFKKKFVSRMRNGHRRLRMQEEAAAPHSNSA